MKKIIYFLFVVLALFTFVSCKDKTKKYKIQFLQDDKSTVIYSYDCEEGKQIVFDGDNPTKKDDDKFTYQFERWDHELGLASKDEDFYAVYKSTAKTDNPTPTPEPIPGPGPEPTPGPGPEPTPGPVEVKGDVLTTQLLGISGNSYANYTYDGDVKYLVYAASNKNVIQITNKEKNRGGFLVTESEKSISNVTINVSADTFGTRVINVFGFNQELTSFDDFYNEALEPVTSFTYVKNESATTFTYEFADSYRYVAITSGGDGNNGIGAILISSVQFVWGEAKEVVIEPADEALKTAFEDFDPTNSKMVVLVKGTNDFSNYEENPTYYFAGDKIKFETEAVDMFGGSEFVTLWLYDKDGVFYLVFEDNGNSSSGYDNIDWSQILGAPKAVQLDDVDGVEESQSKYYYVTETSEEFYTILQDSGFNFFEVPELIYTDFEKYGANEYRAKKEVVAGLCKKLVGDISEEGDEQDEQGNTVHYVITEEFTDLIIKLANGKIASITAKSLYSEEAIYSDGESQKSSGKFTYSYSFSEYGEVAFDIPEATRYITNAKVATAYELENGDSIKISAYVSGINENEKLLYVFDDTGTMAVSYKNTTLSAIPVVGSFVEIDGTVVKDNNVYSINLTSIKIETDNPEEIVYGVISDVIGKDYKYAGEIVSFDYLTLITKDLTNKVIEFEGYDGHRYKLIYTDDEKIIVGVILNDISVNDSVRLNNIAIGYDNNDGFTLRLLKNSSCQKSNGLKISTSDLTVQANTEISAALEQVKLYLYDNGVKSEIASTDYEVLASDYDSTKPGTYLITIKYNNFEAKLSIRVMYDGAVDSFKETSGKGIKYAAEKYNVTYGLNSTGDVNVLVIPVSFTNVEVPDSYEETLNIGFNGTSEETGWESLRSYYQKASYGKLNITATILPVYETGDEYHKSATTINGKKYPDDFCDGYSQLDYKYLAGAIEKYDSEIDYSRYDSNNDGYIDCVYLVYLAPYSKDKDALDLCWAYTYEFYEKNDTEIKFDDKAIDTYMWFSIEFFNDSLNGVSVNSETVIHESGHALGLDDYYDTNYTSNGGYGGGVMMDANVGDHDPYSKALLGWIDPYIVINKNAEIELNSFEKTGDAIFIGKDYNGVYYNEYYIIDYYTPTGLNELQKGSYGLPSQEGIRILHVDARPNDDTSNIISIWNVTNTSNSNANHKLISVVEADNDNSISGNKFMSNSDLWQQGQTLEGIKWYDGTDCGFSITINSIENGKANISVNFGN